MAFVALLGEGGVSIALGSLLLDIQVRPADLKRRRYHCDKARQTVSSVDANLAANAIVFPAPIKRWAIWDVESRTYWNFAKTVSRSRSLASADGQEPAHFYQKLGCLQILAYFE